MRSVLGQPIVSGMRGRTPNNDLGVSGEVEWRPLMRNSRTEAEGTQQAKPAKETTAVAARYRPAPHRREAPEFSRRRWATW